MITQRLEATPSPDSRDLTFAVALLDQADKTTIARDNAVITRADIEAAEEAFDLPYMETDKAGDFETGGTNG